MGKKDVILVLGGGGTMGIFTAGVLKALNNKFRKRIYSIYGTSTGADVGVYFISNQTEIPFNFFVNYLTKREFIRKNLFSYIIKIFFIKDKKNSKIKDFINVDYVVEIAKNSDCKIDLKSFKKARIPFYVKVINVNTSKVEYLSTENNLFKKLKATSQAGPFSSYGIKLNQNYYIDGGTISSKIDLDLIKKYRNKRIIFIESSYSTKLSKIILYPFHIIAGLAIMKLYSRKLGKKYIKELFYGSNKELEKFKNVIYIKNDLNFSAFCTNKKKLKKVYEHGIKIGNKKLKKI